MYMASKNFGDDYAKMQASGKKNSDSKANLSKLDDKYLKRNDIDPHSFKKDVLKNANVKDKTLSHYNIYRDKTTKELFLVHNGNNPAIPTGTILK